MKNYIQNYDKRKYNYETLIKKNDIFLFNCKMLDLRCVTKSKLMVMTKNNALKFGAENRAGNSFIVVNNDVLKKILVNRQGLTHSKSKLSNDKRNTILYSAILLSNAVKLNEGFRDGKYSSVLFNEFYMNDELYVARFIVFDNDLIEIESFRLSSLGVNKNGGRPVINTMTTISTISIKQLLEDVNLIEGYRNSLPLDVLHKLNGKQYCVKYTDIDGLKY